MKREIIIGILVVVLVILLIIRKRAEHQSSRVIKKTKREDIEKIDRENIKKREAKNSEIQISMDVEVPLERDEEFYVDGENKLRIGRLVQDNLLQLAEEGLIDQDVISNLLDEAYCKDFFDLDFPMLKTVNPNKPLNEQIEVLGTPRYWANPISLNKQEFYICNDWNQGNRVYFEMWLRELKGPIVKVDTPVEEDEEKTKEELEMAKFVKEGILELAIKGLLTDEILHQLRNKDYCKATFNINYPVFVKEDSNLTTDEQIRVNGSVRYWPKPLNINGINYYLCDSWYEDNRYHFKNWYSGVKSKTEKDNEDFDDIETENNLNIIPDGDSFTNIESTVRTKLEEFTEKDLITEKMATLLQNSDYCRIVLKLNYPMLLKVNQDEDMDEQREINGNIRYWSKIYTINQEEYFLCNDWYEDRNRNHFEHWANQLS